ncbi:hypothetical protein ACFVOR_34795 [Streptomyces sp. NPDC057837]|uniref:hypothetical protein n=1 Tax=Streptomyces sp. NPDC057837 TaxID=3346260 RepID=UPI0036C07E2F
MTVYFTFVPSRERRPVRLGSLEFAPNQAVPEWALKQRVRGQHGPTYYDGVNRTVALADRPTADFPDADHSACLLVWKRTAAQPVPQQDEAPDEVWTLTPRGRVVRSPWAGMPGHTPSPARKKSEGRHHG